MWDGQSHTILGSKSQRGLTQLSLDVMFRSLGANLVDPSSASLEESLNASDTSEAHIISAASFLENTFGDPLAQSRASRAPTPAMVGSPEKPSPLPQTPHPDSPKSVRLVDEASQLQHRPYFQPPYHSPSPSPQRAAAPDTPHYLSLTKATREKKVAKTDKGEHTTTSGFRKLHAPTALPTNPDVSGVNVSADPSAEYAVVFSMYEVYNDRIFDLLTPPARSNATKELRRRPLVFKSTEASPDRKVVAGLRKVVCGTLSEALMVLEAGLHERRVAGTGTNSVSSRSHGFICVEVKKRKSGRGGAWHGSTLTVVDLAGSERARDAKTQGATLAEAGKINESLMYLGQCLQMQSQNKVSFLSLLYPRSRIGGVCVCVRETETNQGQPNIVPFRQCKLTELLFSNSFPTSPSHKRNPQRAVMIVTADPLGDFNATSQILRYSALAREVTVARIPSVFSKDAPAPPPNRHHHPAYGTTTPGAYPASSPALSRDGGSQGRSASASDREMMELAALEISRLADEVESLKAELERESEGRSVAEAHLLSLEDRMVELEEVIREDCAAEFEKRLALEVSRWKACLAAEVERGGEHWDRKVELLERGLVGVEGEEDKENVLVEGMEEEMERLRRENAVLRRELGGRSPSRRVPLQEREDVLKGGDVEGLGGKMERLRVSGESAKRSGSPKKVRRLPARKWEDAGEDDV